MKYMGSKARIVNDMNLTKTTKPVEKLFVHKSQIKIN